MAQNLSGQTVSSTFYQLLHVPDGVSAQERSVFGGDGVPTALKVSGTTCAVGNIRITGNAISSTDANGNINISPDGTGSVVISKASITGGLVSNVSLSGVDSASFTGNAQTAPVSVSSSGGSLSLNCLSSNVFTTTLNENTTLVVSNPSNGQTINLLITQGATPRTVAWPASFKWPGGSAPSVSSTGSAVDMLVATYISGSWYASLVKDFG